MTPTVTAKTAESTESTTWLTRPFKMNLTARTKGRLFVIVMLSLFVAGVLYGVFGVGLR